MLHYGLVFLYEKDGTDGAEFPLTGRALAGAWQKFIMALFTLFRFSKQSLRTGTAG